MRCQQQLRHNIATLFAIKNIKLRMDNDVHSSAGGNSHKANARLCKQVHTGRRSREVQSVATGSQGLPKAKSVRRNVGKAAHCCHICAPR